MTTRKVILSLLYSKITYFDVKPLKMFTVYKVMYQFNVFLLHFYSILVFCTNFFSLLETS